MRDRLVRPKPVGANDRSTGLIGAVLRRLAGAVGVLLVLFAAPASAEQRLVLMQLRNGFPAEWTMRPTGADLRTVFDLNSDPHLRPTSATTVAPNGRDFAFTNITPARDTITLFKDDRPVAGASFAGPGGVANFDGAIYSPSGARAAVLIGTKLLVVTLPGGAVTQLGTIPGVDPTSSSPFDNILADPVWSPDETTLAFVTALGIDLVPVSGAPRQHIDPSFQMIGSEVAWKPSGDAILVNGNDRLFEISLPSASERLLATDAFEITPTAYSPDGTRIAYISLIVADFRLAVIHADGTHRIRFPDSDTGSTPAWSPDSKRIAFSTDKHGVRVANADGSNDHRVTPPSLRFVGVTGWLPAALMPAPDTSRPSASRPVRTRSTFGGGFIDTLRSTHIVAAKVSVVRHIGGRCQGLTRLGFRTMRCSKARRTFIATAIVAGANGAEWRVHRHLRTGVYAIRVRARDAAGNVSRVVPISMHV
jgi:Tol biopolymer transport system component